MANVPYNQLPELLEIRKPSKVRRAVLIVLVGLITLAVVFVPVYFIWMIKHKDSVKTNTCTSPTCRQQSAGTPEIVLMENN